jgi:EAL domain-containing protein (putative c-di-GMP-specific phosphodiesterase class I)/GGDEF domain-containing protein
VPNTSTTWRGWSADDADASGVVSARLGSTVVANRLFPKVRSWFALGAPLELLSPLSVVRVVTLIALLTWPLGMLAGAIAPALTATWCVATVLVLVWLNQQVTLTPRRTIAIGYVVSVVSALALFSGEGDGAARVTPVALLLVANAIAMGLFARFQVAMVHQAVTALLVGGVTVLVDDLHAVAEAAALFVVTTLVAMTVLVTTRSARAGGTVDPDTGVPNAHGMAERLDVLRRTDHVLVCVAHLQGVAEAGAALGHLVASEIVRRAVEDLGQVMPAGVAIGRMSDDQVLLLAPLAGDAVDRDHQRDDVLAAITAATGAGRYVVGSIEITLNTHVGTSSSAPDDDIDATESIRRATLAARRATSAGVAHAEWDGTSTTLTAHDLDLLTDLRYAADQGELWLAFQPKVAPGGGRDEVTGVEALLRWTSPRHGNVPPARFIPLAESTGLVDRLTEWVLATALDAQVRWRSAGVEIGVAVNVSPASLRSVDFGSQVAQALRSRGLPPHVLTLEVTESLAFDIPEAVERLTPLRALGVKISIDDFGTGYTSLSVLPRLPLDELKVDQQFVRAMPTSPASDAIVRSVCELAHRLGLSVVAEGVEDAELAGRLAGYGFDVLQGYHFSRPVPEHELLALLSPTANGSQVTSQR